MRGSHISKCIDYTEMRLMLAHQKRGKKSLNLRRKLECWTSERDIGKPNPCYTFDKNREKHMGIPPKKVGGRK